MTGANRNKRVGAILLIIIAGLFTALMWSGLSVKEILSQLGF
jgi:hypothetical protein